LYNGTVGCAPHSITQLFGWIPYGTGWQQGDPFHAGFTVVPNLQDVANRFYGGVLPCSGTASYSYGSRFSGLWTNDAQYSWNITNTAEAISLTLTYAMQRYQIDGAPATRKKIQEQTLNVQFTFYKNKIDGCRPGDANGCLDPGRRPFGYVASSIVATSTGGVL
jgi:hypothetical protein